ncbi:MAG TPA: uridine kinase [Terriglobales bacterium]|nr:uridine kinase [Terriglobales bacterium]
MEPAASEKPFVIGIAGPSGAGKTELARSITRVVPATLLSLDSYYRDLSHLPLSGRVKQNFDDPAMIDDALLYEQLTALLHRQPINRPTYDFSCHTRTSEAHILEPHGIIVLEGLFLLYWEHARHLLDLKIYVTSDDNTCFERRLARDLQERGRTPESVRQQYDSTVRAMAERYIYPTRAFADLVVEGTDPLDQTTARVLAFIEDQMKARNWRHNW